MNQSFNCWILPNNNKFYFTTAFKCRNNWQVLSIGLTSKSIVDLITFLIFNASSTVFIIQIFHTSICPLISLGNKMSRASRSLEFCSPRVLINVKMGFTFSVNDFSSTSFGIVIFCSLIKSSKPKFTILLALCFSYWEITPFS